MRRQIEEIITSFEKKKEIYLEGLFLSARWFVLEKAAMEGLNVVVLPNSEAAEYASSDLYALTEGDIVFYLPSSGTSVERSNYKSSLGVQRTSAIGKILSKPEEKTFIVTYPEALEELVPAENSIKKSLLTIKKGDEIKHDRIKEILFSEGFEKVDFVSAPGQFAVRGSVIDIFSYSNNYPYRLSFFGSEVDRINLFNPDTQLSVEDVDAAEIVKAAIENKADIVGLCALMTTTMIQIDKVIEQLHAAGCAAKVMVGGAALTQEYADDAGADAYAPDGVKAVQLAKQMVGID